MPFSIPGAFEYDNDCVEMQASDW